MNTVLEFNKRELMICGAILVFTLIAPFIFPAYKLQMAIMIVYIVAAITWNIQGGETGYNTFGNIMFFGLGMYLCSGIQIGMYFPLAEWTEGGGVKTFIHKPDQYFKGLFVGLFFAGIVPAIVAGLIGYGILGLRGHYFAICTLGIGIASGEIAGGIELIGAGQGMTSPPFPNVGGLEFRGQFLYFLCLTLLVITFAFVRWLYTTRFRLVLNAIRDNEDKAEAMGIETMRYKITGWVISAFFVGIAGGLVGAMVGYIEPVEVAFDGRELGVFMVLMTILGGKGTLWGPIIGAVLFVIFKESFWTLFLGWQYVALGVLIIVIVVYLPEGLMGFLRQRKPEWFGEVIDEKDRKAQVTLD
jgi:branched-chain amino acid transport system permease protein